MPGEWEVTNKYMPMTDPGSILDAFIGGSVFEYTVSNTRTGETRMVKAKNETELGRKIANGEFDD